MKKVLVTGAKGMLGTEVLRWLALDPSCETLPSDVTNLDITDLPSVKRYFEAHRPTHVIHCAAYTAVDAAEKDALRAYQVNAEGTKNLAFFSRELDAELLYISTDYVFAGDKGAHYVESDRTKPINVYGSSKLLGEVYIQTLLEKHKIVRTSWLNGTGGAGFSRNFIETMLRISETRSQLSLINDQVGCPTFTFDLAAALVRLLDVQANGIFHVTNSGYCSWYDFAREIFEVAGKREVQVRPIVTEQYPTAAQRPKYSVLQNTRFPALGLPLLPDWREALREYFRRRNGPGNGA